MGYYLDQFFKIEHPYHLKRMDEIYEHKSVKNESDMEKTRPDRKDVIQRGIIDETGCQRYTMTLEQLQALYKQFENFVADCTQQEYNENKAAIIAVYSLIHKHINAEIYK